MCLAVSGSLLIYSISRGGGYLLSNKITRFFSGISMEIYLSHMMMFRVVEKLGFNKIFDNDLLQYILTTIFVLGAATVFAVVMRKLIGLTENFLYLRKQKYENING